MNIAITVKELSAILLWAAALVGWILNICQVAYSVFAVTAIGDIPPYVILKIVGIFIAPLGSVLGFIGLF